MSAGDVLEWILRAVVVLGLPGILAYAVKQRRKDQAEARAMEAEADVAEGQVQPKVKTTSIVSLEAEIAALSKTFQEDRRLKEQTIDWLSRQLDAERAASARKDLRIRELEEKVQALQTRVAEVSDELARVSEDLKSLHDGDPRQP